MSHYPLITTDQVKAFQAAPPAELTVIKFTADWCGPCKAMAPRMDQLAQAYAAKAQFHSVDAGADRDGCKALGVTTVPTLMAIDRAGNVKCYTGPVADRQLKIQLDKIAG